MVAPNHIKVHLVVISTGQMLDNLKHNRKKKKFIIPLPKTNLQGGFKISI